MILHRRKIEVGGANKARNQFKGITADRKIILRSGGKLSKESFSLKLPFQRLFKLIGISCLSYLVTWLRNGNSLRGARGAALPRIIIYNRKKS